MPHAPNGSGSAISPPPGQPARPAPSGPGAGVPVSVWTDLPAPPTCPGDGPCAGPVTLQTAAQITAAFTRPGDLVLAPDGSAAVIQAAATAGRRVLGLVPDPARGTRLLAGLRACLDPVARPLARLRPGGPATLLAPGNPDAGQAALVITGCHAPGCPAATGAPDAPAAGLLYAACQRGLAPGGVLALIPPSPLPGGRLADRPGQVTAAARAAGLIYAQHIVLVHATIHGGQLTPQPALTGPVPLPGGHRIHSDLLIFTKPGSRS
jgi:hypothetical protein